MTSEAIQIFGIVILVFLGLIGVIYRSLITKINEKVDREMYIQSIDHIQKALEKINGAAETLKQIGKDVIQKDFLTKNEYELRSEIERLKQSKKDENS